MNNKLKFLIGELKGVQVLDRNGDVILLGEYFELQKGYEYYEFDFEKEVFNKKPERGLVTYSDIIF